MDVVTTSLEALIQRVTNPHNQKPDIAATEAFCVMLTKESEGIQIGTKLLALHIQSSNESEALQALALLDACMQRCGSAFHSEIGKFRFLNEMIRLVSPKYLGGRTPSAVRQKVLQLLHIWTKEYPRELKIKEAYEMLKKQGVIEEDAKSIIAPIDDGSKSSKTRGTIFEDEEKSKLLQKLLQSKNPHDLQAANRLIKTMVREDERRVQLNSRRIMELESVHNNAKLLSEMLDSYNRNEATTEDLELMKELYQACERLKPIVLRLANETQDNEEMLGDVLSASDELGRVFEKYTTVMVRGESMEVLKSDGGTGPSLLDLSSPSDNEGDSAISFDDATTATTITTTNVRSHMEVLGDIFNSLDKPADSDIGVSTSNILMPNATIMQPTSILPTNRKGEAPTTPDKVMDSKARALGELNELGESLLKQSLSCTISNPRSKSGSLCGKKTEPLAVRADSMIFPDPLQSEPAHDTSDIRNLPPNDNKLNGVFNCQQDSSTNQLNTTSDVNDLVNPFGDTHAAPAHSPPGPEIKPLADITINLQDIKPGANPPITVIEEKNGISVVLHFARDNPRPDVFVIVITTMSKNEKSLNNYLFQAVIPKRCKCRLHPPSGTELPGHNPFLPPSAITQIMLIANPSKEPVSLKFMLSYTMDDETFTEMGEVEKLPLS